MLYRTAVSAVEPLLTDLLAQGTERVYVIDNGPVAGQAFRGWTPRERVIPLESGGNIGYGRGNNLAIGESVERHKYHLICNPDVALHADTIAKLYALLERRPEIGLCMPRVVGLDGNVQHLCKRAPSPLDYLSGVIAPRGWGRKRRMRLEMRDHSYDQEMEVECLSGCFMFFRSSVLAALQGFDPRFFLYFEDFDLSRRARVLGRNVYYPAAQITHGHAREHRHSMRARLHFVVSAMRYFNKWGWLG